MFNALLVTAANAFRLSEIKRITHVLILFVTRFNYRCLSTLFLKIEFKDN